MPERHSADQQVFLHRWHLEFVGRFPSLQWWCWTTDESSWPGTQVAHSLQLATLKSWHSRWTQYSQTSQRTAFVSTSIFRRQTLQNFRLRWPVSVQQWGTGFLITFDATVEHGETTTFMHRSWTTKLHTSQMNPWPIRPHNISDEIITITMNSAWKSNSPVQWWQ